MDLQLPVKGPVGRKAYVGDQSLDFPGARLAAAASGDLEALIRPGPLSRLNHGLTVKLDVAFAARRQGVGPNGQAVALLERIIGNALDGLRAGAASQPVDPGIRVILSQ